MMALVKPARSPSLPVPKVKLRSWAGGREYVYASAASRSAPAWVLMCRPSATSAIEPNSRPPAISAIIMAPHSQITAHVLRSLFSWPSPRKTWLWDVENPGLTLLLMAASFQVATDDCEQLLGRLVVQG